MSGHVQRTPLNKQQVNLAHGQVIVIIVRYGGRIFKNLGINIRRFRRFRVLKRGTTTRILTERFYLNPVMIISHNRIRFFIFIQELNLIIFIHGLTTQPPFYNHVTLIVKQIHFLVHVFRG